MNPSAPETYAPASTTRQQSMADLWNEFPSTTGALAPAVMHQIALQLHHAPVVATLPVADAVAATPYEESLIWMLAKHGMQLALVASVLLLVVSGGSSPVLALAYVGTGLMLMGILAVVDRQLFIDSDSGIEIIDVVEPRMAEVEPMHGDLHQQHLAALQAAYHNALMGSPSPLLRPSPLSPLVEQMQVVMPDGVAVT